MPVLGVIFLGHATNRYDAACREIAQEQAAGKIPKRPLNKADFLKRRALMLPKEARDNELMRLPKGEDLGAALVSAMNAVEREFELLLNQLPKDCGEFEPSVLENLLRIFDSETLRTRGPVLLRSSLPRRRGVVRRSSCWQAYERERSFDMDWFASGRIFCSWSRSSSSFANSSTTFFGAPGNCAAKSTKNLLYSPFASHST